MKKLNVDLEAVLFKYWCHGILNFDLKTGITESHKSIVLNVKWFKEIFDNTTVVRPKSLKLKMIPKEAAMLSLNSPHILKYPKSGLYNNLNSS